MLTIKNLTKKYGDTVALDNVSFSIPRGKVTGFLGPNGAGKTTTLQIMTGFLKPDKGSVYFDKKSIALKFKTIAQNIGYLPENNPLYQNMRVDEFLIFNARMKQLEDTDELKDIAKKCGIKSVLTKKIEQLSKGYKQRVGLAKSLIGNPTFLILDEPTAGLDPNQKEDILSLIKSYSKNRTVFFSSHVLSEVREIADEVIIINEGKIVAKGGAKKLAQKHFKGVTILLTTNAPYAKFLKAIKNIDTITNVKKRSQSQKKFKTYAITCQEEEKTALEIFNVIVKNKWKLTQLHSQAQGLEELFKDLTKHTS